MTSSFVPSLGQFFGLPDLFMWNKMAGTPARTTLTLGARIWGAFSSWVTNASGYQKLGNISVINSVCNCN